MGWIAEAKAEKQKLYGYYCNLCRTYDITPKPFYLFTVSFYYKFKESIKTFNTK